MSSSPIPFSGHWSCVYHNHNPKTETHNNQDYNYGSQFWDHDYDIHMTNAMRREMVMNSLKTQLLKYEKRLSKPIVEVNVIQKEYRLSNNIQLRRRIEIIVKGQLLRSNEPFRFQTGFFIGPLLFD